MNYVYLIRCNDNFQTKYKIGIAQDVQTRLAQLQTGSPYVLEVTECYGYENAEVVERALHQAFKSQRIQGEWFELNYIQATEDFPKICAMLGGSVGFLQDDKSDPDDVEEAEDALGYQPTIEDVKRIMADSNYRLEYRHNEKGLRGFAWRLRSGNKECPLYIGKSNPIFEQVKQILPEHKKSSETTTEEK